MCGRYTLEEDPNHIIRHYKAPKNDAVEHIHANYNVAPTQTMPVVTDTGDGPTVEMMKWGIPTFIGPGKVKDVINTRSEKALANTWKRITLHTRCLVPANGYYEWKSVEDDGKIVKHPIFFKPKQLELFSFAGIWNVWKDKETGEEVKVYSILTTEPNKEASEVHNRMPVILHPDDEATWLSPENNDNDKVIESLLRPLEDGGLESWEVSRSVNNVRLNNKSLVHPLNSK